MITIGTKRRLKPIVSVRWRHEGHDVETADGTHRHVGRLGSERLAKHVVRLHNGALETR